MNTLIHNPIHNQTTTSSHLVPTSSPLQGTTSELTSSPVPLPRRGRGHCESDNHTTQNTPPRPPTRDEVNPHHTTPHPANLTPHTTDTHQDTDMNTTEPATYDTHPGTHAVAALVHVHVAGRCIKNRDGAFCLPDATRVPAVDGDDTRPPWEADPVGYLTDTADLMRHGSHRATNGPWSVPADARFRIFGVGAKGQPVPIDEDELYCTEDAEHIAAWDPDMALAAATVLDATAALLRLSGGKPYRELDHAVMAMARAYRGDA